ncbi:MAG: Crp/Fnr family transcriptional regulator [Bacteroidota bacterium]
MKSRIEEVAPVSEELWNEILLHAKIVDIEKGQKLVTCKSTLRRGYFIVSGSFESSIITTDGSSKTIWFYFDELFPVIVCMDSYFMGIPTMYQVTALEQSKVIVFEKEMIDAWVLKYPSFNEYYRSDLAKDFMIASEIRNHLVSRSSLDFLKYIHANYPILLSRTPSKNVAHFMGITPEWYSKLKRRIS